MTVTVYTKPGCMPCRATKRDLARLGVAYVEEPITPEVVAELAEAGHLAAPVVIAGDEMWSGYRPDRIAQLAAAAPLGGA